MRLSVLFALTFMLTVFNLVFMQFYLLIILWATGSALAFVFLNVIGEKLHLWSGVAWEIAAACVVIFIIVGELPGDEIREGITTFSGIICAWYAAVLFRKEKRESLSMPGKKKSVKRL